VIAEILITFGALFLVGLLADVVGRHTPIPRVTLLLVVGVGVGSSGLGWLPSFTDDWFPVLARIALAMIGFVLGQSLTKARMGELGRPVLALSVGVVVATSILVFAGLALVGAPLVAALLLAGIAPATAPAASVDVVRESGARGRFTDTLLGIVAIDDAWGLLAFGILLAATQAVSGVGDATACFVAGAWDLGGAVGLGVLLGLPLAYLTGRVRPGEPSQAEALGAVVLSAGLAEALGVSPILTAVVMGTVVANVARHHERPFRAIEGIEWPFLILFFLLAGASLRVDALIAAGPIAVAYVLLRTLGRVVGTRAAGRLVRTSAPIRRWMGLALLPQAGVSVGMALVAAQRFPDVRDVVLPVVLGSTVVFELVGPVMSRWILRHVGDIPGERPRGPEAREVAE